MTKRLFALLCALLALPAAVPAQRLARTVIPTHYQLELAPDFASETFAGEEIIEVSVAEPTNAIELHAVEIEIDRSEISSDGAVQQATVSYDEARETATLTVSETIGRGPAVIRIAYRGLLNRDLRGFYVGESGGEKYAASQMEALDARRAFPSFDEPWMKATFDVTLVVDEGHRAISNGAVVSDTPGPAPGKHTVRFATTPRMSTYLVALVVGRFDCLEGEHQGVPLGICAAPEKVHLGAYALEATKVVLDTFDPYFDYPYPFGKLDQIAVADFRAGAMENTGAVIYRESALLADPAVASEAHLRRVASVIAHEIAHMWFGDLVTMRWWDDIWLNEGFANFMEEKAIREWRPEWNVDVLVAAGHARPLASDVLASTRRIRTEGETPAEIESMFDGIAYGKTAAVLHMIEALIGEEAMRRGIASYVKRHAYGNTSAADFFDALSDAGGDHVGAIMRSYVDQPGVPVVTVDAECDGDSTVVSLSQRRFFVDRARLATGSDQLWRIPVCFEGGPCVVLTERRQHARLDGCRVAPFANRDGRGYYLTDYSTDTRRRLVERLTELSAQERLALVRDEWYLVRVGERGIGDYLEVVAALIPGEGERLVLEEVLERIAYLEERLVGDDDLPALRQWIREVLGPVAEDLGWAPLAEEAVELRAAVLRTLGVHGADPRARAWARRLAEDHLTGSGAVHPSLAGAVLEVAAVDGDRSLHERYLAALERATDPEAARRLMQALTRFADDEIRRQNLELALGETIRTQDTMRFLYGIASDRDGPAMVWPFLAERWDEIGERVPPRHASALVSGVGGGLCAAEDVGQVTAFVEANGVEIVDRDLAKAEERIASCLDMKLLHGDELAAYLGARSPIVVGH